MKSILLHLATLTCSLSLYTSYLRKNLSIKLFSAIEEANNGNFIGCGDSLQEGFIFKIDRHGNLISTFFPKLRDNKVAVQDISIDDINGGYAICGTLMIQLEIILLHTIYY